jgi:hypothetical protein
MQYEQLQSIFDGPITVGVPHSIHQIKYIREERNSGFTKVVAPFHDPQVREHELHNEDQHAGIPPVAGPDRKDVCHKSRTQQPGKVRQDARKAARAGLREEDE